MKTEPPKTLAVYIDYKSPYAYLAKHPVYALAEATGVALDWRPYDLDLGSFMGTARLDPATGRVIEENRSAHQWRRVKYSYMDCRRQARKQGIVIRGTQKIWNSRVALIGMLYARAQGEAVLRGYHDRVFERFWKRELDIEDPAVVAAVLAEAGADARAFPAYLAGDGPAVLAACCRDAEDKGVFGVPSFILDGELFWGSEHLPDIRAKLTA